jgi:hypothetical protein
LACAATSRESAAAAAVAYWYTTSTRVGDTVTGPAPVAVCGDAPARGASPACVGTRHTTRCSGWFVWWVRATAPCRAQPRAGSGARARGQSRRRRAHANRGGHAAVRCTVEQRRESTCILFGQIFRRAEFSHFGLVVCSTRGSLSHRQTPTHRPLHAPPAHPHARRPRRWIYFTRCPPRWRPFPLVLLAPLLLVGAPTLRLR